MKQPESPKAILNFSTFEVKDLEDIVYPIADLPKKLGNLLYTNGDSVEIADIGRSINKGIDTQVNLNELEDVINIISSKPLYRPWVMSAILGYLQEKKVQLIEQTPKPEEEILNREPVEKKLKPKK